MLRELTKSESGCGFDNNVTEMLNFLILKTELWLRKRAFFFLEYTLSYLVVKKKIEGSEHQSKG